MSKVTMPDPVAWVRQHPDGALTAEFLEDAVISPVRKESGAWLPMVTTTQAEAYADARVREARQWQPIETAPKDFVTEFDGWNGERVPNVIWAHPEYEAKGEYAWCRAFYEHNHGWTMERVRGLTHWMPLPVPPQ